MNNYEVLSKNCKIRWIENFDLTTQKYKQVSGYVFNDNNELLIVKNKVMNKTKLKVINGGLRNTKKQ